MIASRPLVAFIVVVVAWASLHAQTPKQAIAHRGASADRPENTLAAFELAAEQGADVLECDVRATADGRLVLAASGALVINPAFNARLPYDSFRDLEQHQCSGAWVRSSFARYSSGSFCHFPGRVGVH